MRYFIPLLIIFLGGCSIKSKEYVIPFDDPKPHKIAKVTDSIGVYEIILPQYLQTGEIAYAQKGKIRFAKGVYFALDPQEYATKRAIEILKEALDDRNVRLYPWDSDRRPSIVIKIEIDEFLPHPLQKIVKIKLTYRFDGRSGKVVASAPCDGSVKSMVGGMQKAFDEALLKVAADIADYTAKKTTEERISR